LIWKWFADLAIVVTIQTTILSLLVPFAFEGVHFGAYHRLWVGVRSGGRIPLHRHLARWTGVWTVIPGKTWLIRAHSPSCILRSWRDCDQSRIRRKLTLPSSSLNVRLFRWCFQWGRSQFNSTLSALGC
jgi:hypothetical protein